MDLRLKDGEKCLLCRNPKSSHDGGDYDTSSCMEAIKTLLDFMEKFRMGLWDREDFTVVVEVKKGKLVAIGPPRRVLRTKS